MVLKTLRLKSLTQHQVKERERDINVSLSANPHQWGSKDSMTDATLVTDSFFNEVRLDNPFGIDSRRLFERNLALKKVSFSRTAARAQAQQHAKTLTMSLDS